MALKSPPAPPGGELLPCRISGKGREKKSGRWNWGNAWGERRGTEGEEGRRGAEGKGAWEIWLRPGENLVGARVEGILGREEAGAANWMGDLRMGIEVGIGSLGLGGRAGEVGVCTWGSIFRDSKANFGVGERRSCAGEDGWGTKLGVG